MHLIDWLLDQVLGLVFGSLVTFLARPLKDRLVQWAKATLVSRVRHLVLVSVVSLKLRLGSAKRS